MYMPLGLTFGNIKTLSTRHNDCCRRWRLTNRCDPLNRSHAWCFFDRYELMDFVGGRQWSTLRQLEQAVFCSTQSATAKTK